MDKHWNSRYKIIKKYPGMHGRVGDITIGTNINLEAEFPGIFERVLDWYNGVSVPDLPLYVKKISTKQSYYLTGDILKVTKWVITIDCVTNKNVFIAEIGSSHKFNVDELYPANDIEIKAYEKKGQVINVSDI